MLKIFSRWTWSRWIILVASASITVVLCSCFATTLLRRQPAVTPVSRSTAVSASERQVRFFAIGDWGTVSDAQQQVAGEMAKESRTTARLVDAVLLLGDNFYGELSGVSDPLWNDQFESMYDKAALPEPFYAILGNHDYEREKASIQLSYEAANSGTRWRMPSRWYRVELPQENPLVTVLMIDSNLDNLTSEMNAEQMRWLTAQLSKPRTTRWLLVAAHHPLYSHGKEHGDDPRLIGLWRKLFEDAKVDFYLCGHDHHLEHIRRPDSNIDYLISGGGGVSTRPVAPGPTSQFAAQLHGFVSMTFGENSADVHFISHNGVVVHSFSKEPSTIRTSSPQPR